MEIAAQEKSAPSNHHALSIASPEWSAADTEFDHATICGVECALVFELEARMVAALREAEGVQLTAWLRQCGDRLERTTWFKIETCEQDV